MLLHNYYKLEIQRFHNKSVFPFSGLNVSLYVADGKVPDEKLMQENQNLVPKTQLQVQKQRTLRREELTSKYNNYR